MRLAVLLLFALTMWGQPKPVWIDCDPSARPGGHEIDDVVALLQAFHSPELAIRGVSIVFGNADLPTADRIGRQVAEKFGPAGLPVFTGAASAAQLGQETAASKALAAALRKERLTILVLGPATNVATVFQNHPELVKQAVQVIGVAGRRPGQHFRTSPRQTKPFQDLNFELDHRAYDVLLRRVVPLVLAPWEISAQVHVTKADIDRAAATSPGVRWLQPAAHDWLAFWQKSFGVPYFNPFDALAVGYAINPTLLRCDSIKAAIEEAADDTGTKPRKPHLHVGLEHGLPVTYCHTPGPGFHGDLLRRLATK